jgi:Tetratricopeptide repeat
MASLYRDQRQYDKAEPLYDRARVIVETALGPEHPDVGPFTSGRWRFGKRLWGRFTRKWRQP